MKDKLLNIRVKDELIERLNEVSAHLDIPYSQIVREAIDEKLERLEREHPKLAVLEAVAA